jgi:hypothetical protein
MRDDGYCDGLANGFSGSVRSQYHYVQFMAACQAHRIEHPNGIHVVMRGTREIVCTLATAGMQASLTDYACHAMRLTVVKRAQSGGEGGIRTREAFGLHDFQSCALDRTMRPLRKWAHYTIALVFHQIVQPAGLCASASRCDASRERKAVDEHLIHGYTLTLGSECRISLAVGSIVETNG